MENLNLIESDILVWIQDHLRFPALDVIMPYISKLNNAGAIAILTVVVFLLWKKHRDVGLTALSSLFVEFILVNVIIKRSVCRIRPFYVNESLQFLGTKPLEYSFPSGHTGAAFAVSTVMFLCMPKKWGIPAIVLSALIAYSRLYNGVHYPTDVLGALVIGVTTGILASKIVFPRAVAWLAKRRSAE